MAITTTNMNFQMRTLRLSLPASLRSSHATSLALESLLLSPPAVVEPRAEPRLEPSSCSDLSSTVVPSAKRVFFLSFPSMVNVHKKGNVLQWVVAVKERFCKQAKYVNWTKTKFRQGTFLLWRLTVSCVWNLCVTQEVRERGPMGITSIYGDVLNGEIIVPKPMTASFFDDCSILQYEQEHKARTPWGII